MNSRTRNDKALAWMREANPISEADVAADLSAGEIRDEMARAMAAGELANDPLSLAPGLTKAASARMKGSKESLGRRLASARGFRIAAVGLGVLACGGTAMATTGIWNPFAETSGESKVSNTPVPAGLVAELGILRREQTGQDRSPEVEATLKGTLHELKYMGDFSMRLGSVRHLAPVTTEAPMPNGKATILLSGVETERPLIEPEKERWTADEEVVCVARPVPRRKVAPLICFDRSELMSGHAVTGVIDPAYDFGVAFGVVPDGVATVTAEFDNAPAVTVPVKNNYWELSLSGRQLSKVGKTGYVSASEPLPGVRRTVWRDKEGKFIPRQHPSVSWWVKRVRQEAKTNQPYGPEASVGRHR